MQAKPQEVDPKATTPVITAAHLPGLLLAAQFFTDRGYDEFTLEMHILGDLIQQSYARPYIPAGMREAFEVWVLSMWAGARLHRRDALPGSHLHYGEYVDEYVQRAWVGWQACAAQPSPDGSSSDKTRAELYDEVWQKARDMGYGNVTGALLELDRIKARQADLSAELQWTHHKPDQQGAYWIRGNSLEAPALVQVKLCDDGLWCNLHIRTTEPNFEYGFSIAQLNDQFEWLGPLQGGAQ
ncbi:MULTISPECIES: hypothetical protein [unclassified Pseudomonas]|uniref:hypothetical protein n=1 Tax=unclassified Pseudomonas TaxID=196821 RepID=UPI00244A0A96|nr:MULTISPECIES: hypothetical protein [unclassified Pseudomonas]MDH0894660.1 hypothetical protein [Pseudomonas sp. GD03875]MDH1067290.1 hypothetical protein [Pseudomonas sp. GD03985]